jgi:hypothetical protein
MSFTPGPWFVAPRDDTGYPKIRPDHEPAYCVGIAPANIGMSPEETLANAQLMAAAPEMYSALLAVLHPAGDTADEVRAQVHAALEKAVPRWPE